MAWSISTIDEGVVSFNEELKDNKSNNKSSKYGVSFNEELKVFYTRNQFVAVVRVYPLMRN